jgi:hypothetical protein
MKIARYKGMRLTMQGAHKGAGSRETEGKELVGVK